VKKTLHPSFRVSDLTASLAFYTALGYGEVGPVELPGGPDGPRTGWVVDPDGIRIELVQWPPGHADGISPAHFDPGAAP
jgi:lactoylglutathione lyase